MGSRVNSLSENLLETFEVRAVDAVLERRLDMGDATQYSSAVSAEVEAIVSFDKHFNSLKLPRLEPSDIV